MELGFFQPANDSARKVESAPTDPLALIVKQRAIPHESLVAFGAKTISPRTIELPAYGPDGKQCTTLRMSSGSDKGYFAEGQPAGLLFPHDDDTLRLPKSGETWLLVEGVGNAAALHGMGFLVCGLNTCRLARKFARILAGVKVILIPRRDHDGEEGSKHSTRVARRVAESIAVAALPADLKDSCGADVRDVLRQPNGEQLLRQAIDDAAPAETGRPHASDSPGSVSAEIEMPEGEPISLTVSSAGNKPQRLVLAQRGDVAHRDRINTDSSVSRDRFAKKLASKLDLTFETVGPLVDPKITELADRANEQRSCSRGLENRERESQATIAAITGKRGL